MPPKNPPLTASWIRLADNPDNHHLSKVTNLLSPESHIHLPPFASSSTATTLGCCNGLLLIGLNFANHQYEQLLLCNPATRQYQAVPLPPDLKMATSGFGYDSLSGDYKVVNFTSNSLQTPFSIKVWTTGSNQWAEISMVLPNFLEGFYIVPEGLLIGEHLYWMAHPEFASGVNKARRLVFFSVSLSDYTINQITTSDIFAHYNDDCVLDLREFRGSFAVFAYTSSLSADFFSYNLDMWVMDDSGRDCKIAWNKLFSTGPLLEFFYAFRVCVNGNFVLMSPRTKKRYLYDPHTKEEKQLMISIDGVYTIEFWKFHESLVSVKMCNDCRGGDSADVYDPQQIDNNGCQLSRPA